MNKIKCVIKRSGTKVPYKKQRISNAIYRAAVSVGGRDRELSEKLADKVEEILVNNFKNSPPHIENIQDIVEKVLIKNGHSQVSKAYILYRNENIKKRELRSKKDSSTSGNIPWQKIWQTLNWAVEKDLDTIKSLNKRIENGEFAHIVHESENHYEDQIKTAAALIAERSNKLKLVFVSGPSSSGKTTTTTKLEIILKKSGYKFKAFNVDNYFFDLEYHPKDEFGDYDFETPQALDLELINKHTKKLINGNQISMPYYDFATGKRIPNQKTLKLADNEILLIDSLHGLYPPMSEGIDDEHKFKLYLEPLFQIKDKNGKYIRWTDIRLMRRMLRDSVFRAYNPRQTLEHWHYVRSSETRHIIPFLNQSDYIINTAMPYELPIYKNKLFSYFKKWKQTLKNNTLKEDAHKRAVRIFQFLEEVNDYSDDSSIPSTSVIREFIGGSNFKY